MQIKLYIDDFFFINFLFDFAILEISGLIFLGNNINHKKNVCIACIQAITICCVIYIYGMKILSLKGPAFFLCLLNCIVDAIVISRENNFTKKVFDLLKKVPVVFFVTFFLGGAFNYIMYRTHIGVGFYLILKKYGHIIICISYSAVIVAFICIVRKIIVNVRTEIFKSKMKCKVVLKLNDKKIYLNALMDTGNSLYEPVSKRPVSIVEQKAITIFQNEKISNIYVIPYKSVGVEEGFVYGIEIDEMDVITQNIKFTKKKIILGIYKGSLSSDNSYSIILNKCYCDSISD